MADFECKLEGLDEALKKLTALDQKMQTKIFAKSTKAGAKVILPVAQSLAPHLTGLLESNIRIRSTSRPSKGIFRSSVGVGAKDWTGPAFYATFVMWGHHAGSRKLGSSRTFIKGDDFLKISVGECGEQAAQKMVETIIDGVS